MVKHVSAVFVGVGSKTPLSIFDNVFMHQYLKMLDPKHTPPYRLERVRFIEVLIDTAMMELMHNTKVGVHGMALMLLFHILLCMHYLHYYINPSSLLF
jgi:hypothetical protein